LPLDVLVAVVRLFRENIRRLPPGLLEKLAGQFGMDNPNATGDEREAFLKAKAEEYQELKTRAESLGPADERVSKFLAASEVALNQGNFTTADHLMELALSLQSTIDTIPALKKDADLWFLHGKTALLSGNVDEAARRFRRAADCFYAYDGNLAAPRVQGASILRVSLPERSGIVIGRAAVHDQRRLLGKRVKF
jgi:tetratricopeptide (TPR) repeat protein